MLLFIIALLIAGGVIAYVGDRLGTYIGKRRLSAWGLRPRHTAMLYTVVSGGLIAVLTLFALIGYDRTVQRALLEGPQLIQENESLRDTIRSRDAAARTADAQASAAEARLQAAEDRLRRALANLTGAQATLRRSRGELARRQEQLTAARRQLVTLNAGLGATRATLLAARGRLTKAQAAVRQAHQSFLLAKSQYGQALKTVDALSTQGEQLAGHNTALTQQNRLLASKNQQLLTQTTYLQGASLIYHKGQELGRSVIPTDLTADQARARLVAFLNSLGQDAARRGAASPDGVGRCIRVIAPSSADPQADVPEDEALDALSQDIAAEAPDAPGVVVVAVAHYNAFVGTPVPVELKPYDNLLVYHKGDDIAETTVDGSETDDEILSALASFLRSQVQPNARARGIIPRVDPETGELRVGEPTDSEATDELVRQIERDGPGARVTARAAADTYSSGPLRLSLTVAAGPAPVTLPVPPAPVPPAPAPRAPAPHQGVAGR